MKIRKDEEESWIYSISLRIFPPTDLTIFLSAHLISCSFLPIWYIVDYLTSLLISSDSFPSNTQINCPSCPGKNFLDKLITFPSYLVECFSLGKKVKKFQGFTLLNAEWNIFTSQFAKFDKSKTMRGLKFSPNQGFYGYVVTCT
jgi:hypothetical protein